MAKTLSDYTKAELVAYAEEFGVELKTGLTKDGIIAAFAEDGVTVELINGLFPVEEEAEVAEDAPVEAAPVAEVSEDENPILVKMTRTNRTYEIRGYRFTKEHPFALVAEADADYLIETAGGFSMASPKEAREYYS